MQNRLKQLPLNVQKWVYEIAGMAGTVYFLADVLQPKSSKFPAFEI